MTSQNQNGFGSLLRSWRGQRRASQLDLALAADVSARHISFLETGRARPSRSMVLRLAGELDVPLEERNEWLHAAGLAPVYRRRDADEAELAMARDAVAWMVEHHAPYPAFALDRHWRITEANTTARMLLSGFGIAAGDSLLDAFLGSDALRGAVLNLLEVTAHTRSRLVAESRHYGGDAILDEAVRKLDAMGALATLEPTDAFVPIRYLFGGEVWSFMSAFANFQTAQDIGLSELRVELMFPADAETKERMMALKL